MNSYYCIDELGNVSNIISFESDQKEIEFDGVIYYLNDRNLRIGQSITDTYYWQVKTALDGRLQDTDFWELPSVQQEVLNGAELVAYRKAVRELRLDLTQENFMEIYDSIPEKPTEQWNRQEI
jgi:hypothetical protein